MVINEVPGNVPQKTKGLIGEGSPVLPSPPPRSLRQSKRPPSSPSSTMMMIEVERSVKVRMDVWSSQAIFFFSFFVSRIYGLWLRFPPFLFIFDRQKDNGMCTIMSGIEGVLWYFDTSLIRLQRTRIVENRKGSQTDTDLFLNLWCTMCWFIRTPNMKTYVRVLPKLPYDCDPPIPPHSDQGIEPIGSGVCLIVFDVEGQVRTDRSLTLELNF